MADLAELMKSLRDGLEGVASGPWDVEYGESGNGGPDRYAYALLRRVADESNPGGIETGEVGFDGSPILEHLARCSPENIEALLDSHDALVKALREIQDETRGCDLTIETVETIDDLASAALATLAPPPAME